MINPGRNSRSALLAPFAVRDFRLQFPADLATSWGIEMEVLILGWYILAETGSVFLLTVYGSLQYTGTLVAPVIGMAGDRFGHRNVLCVMRASYAVLAAVMAAMAFTGTMRPVFVLSLAAVNGIVRPSDLAIRNALVADIMPAGQLMPAMGVSRTTSDSARIFGSMAGAALLATLGIGPAYVVIVVLYLGGLVMTARIHQRPPGVPASARGGLAFLREVQDGMAYVRHTPNVHAGMWLAFLVNLLAFPMTSGLLPYVAREVYHIGQTGLGTLVASFATGALLGSLTTGVLGASFRPARMMMLFATAWFALVLVFVQMPGPTGGRISLVLAGYAQSLSMVPLATMLLRTAGTRYRGRVMGVRMLAIYGLPLGLLGTGLLIPRIGFQATASLYCVTGLGCVALIWIWWRRAVWPLDAVGNQR